MINGFRHIEYRPIQYDEKEMLDRSLENFKAHNQRRSVRNISDRIFPRQILDNILMTASTAPSGAHKQPWTFCVVSDETIKSKIRQAAEKEEKESYRRKLK